MNKLMILSGVALLGLAGAAVAQPPEPGAAAAAPTSPARR